MGNTDFEILSGIIGGNKNAFDLLFVQYYSRLCNYATSVIHNCDVAEDLVQDLFAEIWVTRKQLNIKTSFSSYLYRSVYHSCLDHLKHQKIREKHQNNSLLQTPASFNDSLVFAELQEKMDSCIEQLPEQCKKIFKLSRFEKLKYRERAEKLQISENSVDTQIRRALNKLRDELKDYLITILIIFSFLF